MPESISGGIRLTNLQKTAIDLFTVLPQPHQLSQCG
jgi:hypothetical protein